MSLSFCWDGVDKKNWHAFLCGKTVGQPGNWELGNWLSFLPNAWERLGNLHFIQKTWSSVALLQKDRGWSPKVLRSLEMSDHKSSRLRTSCKSIRQSRSPCSLLFVGRSFLWFSIMLTENRYRCSKQYLQFQLYNNHYTENSLLYLQWASPELQGSIPFHWIYKEIR